MSRPNNIVKDGILYGLNVVYRLDTLQTWNTVTYDLKKIEYKKCDIEDCYNHSDCHYYHNYIHPTLKRPVFGTCSREDVNERNRIKNLLIRKMNTKLHDFRRHLMTQFYQIQSKRKSLIKQQIKNNDVEVIALSRDAVVTQDYIHLQDSFKKSLFYINLFESCKSDLKLIKLSDKIGLNYLNRLEYRSDFWTYPILRAKLQHLLKESSDNSPVSRKNGKLEYRYNNLDVADLTLGKGFKGDFNRDINSQFGRFGGYVLSYDFYTLFSGLDILKVILYKLFNPYLYKTHDLNLILYDDKVKTFNLCDNCNKSIIAFECSKCGNDVKYCEQCNHLIHQHQVFKSHVPKRLEWIKQSNNPELIYELNNDIIEIIFDYLSYCQVGDLIGDKLTGYNGIGNHLNTGLYDPNITTDDTFQRLLNEQCDTLIFHTFPNNPEATQEELLKTMNKLFSIF